MIHWPLKYKTGLNNIYKKMTGDLISLAPKNIVQGFNGFYVLIDH